MSDPTRLDTTTGAEASSESVAPDPVMVDSPIDSAAREPLLIEVHHGIRTQRAVDEAMERLRSTRQLRELTISESGRRIAEVPPGTYFHVEAFSIRALGWNPAESKLREEFSGVFGERTAMRYGAKWDAEVHYAQGTEHLLNVFTTEEAASGITQLSGNEAREVSATVFPWGTMTSLVSVPVSRVNRCRWRYVQGEPEFDLVILDFEIQ